MKGFLRFSLAEMSDAPSVSGVGMSTASADPRGEDEGNCEAESQGLRRSVRIQNHANPMGGNAWQGRPHTYLYGSVL